MPLTLFGSYLLVVEGTAGNGPDKFKFKSTSPYGAHDLVIPTGTTIGGFTLVGPFGGPFVWFDPTGTIHYSTWFGNIVPSHNANPIPWVNSILNAGSPNYWQKGF
jgi:hypothetical protein